MAPTLRVVDPLSLATIVDSIMVEVEDLNHYGVGLLDFVAIPIYSIPDFGLFVFASEHSFFSLVLTHSLEWVWGKGVPPLEILIS